MSVIGSVIAPSARIGIRPVINPFDIGVFSIVIHADIGTTEYLRDWQGELILDSDGNPIPVSGGLAGQQYLKDMDGILILDSNDNPIPVIE